MPTAITRPPNNQGGFYFDALINNHPYMHNNDPWVEECEYCEGEGEGVVSCMEYVYPGEPHMADIGSEQCMCQCDQ